MYAIIVLPLYPGCSRQDHWLLALPPPTTEIVIACFGESVMEEEQGGFSDLFYVMLILGIIGLVGFVIVAGGAAGG